MNLKRVNYITTLFTLTAALIKDDIMNTPDIDIEYDDVLQDLPLNKVSKHYDEAYIISTMTHQKTESDDATVDGTILKQTCDDVMKLIPYDINNKEIFKKHLYSTMSSTVELTQDAVKKFIENEDLGKFKEVINTGDSLEVISKELETDFTATTLAEYIIFISASGDGDAFNKLSKVLDLLDRADEVYEVVDKLIFTKLSGFLTLLSLGELT